MDIIWKAKYGYHIDHMELISFSVKSISEREAFQLDDVPHIWDNFSIGKTQMEKRETCDPPFLGG